MKRRGRWGADSGRVRELRTRVFRNDQCRHVNFCGLRAQVREGGDWHRAWKERLLEFELFKVELGDGLGGSCCFFVSHDVLTVVVISFPTKNAKWPCLKIFVV